MTETKIRPLRRAYLITLSLGFVSFLVYMVYVLINMGPYGDYTYFYVRGALYTASFAVSFAYGFQKNMRQKTVVATAAYALLAVTLLYNSYYEIFYFYTQTWSALAMFVSAVLFAIAAASVTHRYGKKGLVTIAAVIAVLCIMHDAAGEMNNYCYFDYSVEQLLIYMTYYAMYILLYAAILQMSLSNGFIAPEEQLSYNEEAQRQKTDYDAEIQALIAARTRGEIGPEEYERRRVEILNKLQ